MKSANWRSCWLTLSLLLSGCGWGNVNVKGQLVYPDGSPVSGLKNGDVIFELQGENYSAISPIDEQGGFDLFSIRPGDGLKRGTYKVAIQPYIPLVPTPTQDEPGKPAAPAPAPPPFPLDARYRSTETSGLEVEVTHRLRNLKLTVDRGS